MATHQKTEDGTGRSIVMVRLKSGTVFQGPIDFSADFAHWVTLNMYEHDPGDMMTIPWAAIDYIRYLPEDPEANLTG